MKERDSDKRFAPPFALPPLPIVASPNALEISSIARIVIVIAIVIAMRHAVHFILAGQRSAWARIITVLKSTTASARNNSRAGLNRGSIIDFFRAHAVRTMKN